MTKLCEHVMRDLSGFLDGELYAGRVRRIEQHLAAGCSDCTSELRRLECLRDLVILSDPAYAAPEVDVERHVMRRVRAESVGPPIGASMLQWRLATAAMVCAAIVVGVIIGMTFDGSQQQMTRGLSPDGTYAGVELRGSPTIGDDDVDMIIRALGRIQSGDADTIIAVLMPAEIGDSELVNEALWYESPVDELVETLTRMESTELRGELYDYAIQG